MLLLEKHFVLLRCQCNENFIFRNEIHGLAILPKKSTLDNVSTFFEMLKVVVSE